MSTQTKRHIDTTPDGSLELFQAPTDYIVGTLWVIEVGSVTSIREASDIGGGFYQVSPAPEAGAKLYITYDIVVVDASLEDGLTPWEHENMNSLLAALTTMQDALNAMSDSMGERVTQSNFDTWASIIEAEVRDLKSVLVP